jgi:hypothetical protein
MPGPAANPNAIRRNARVGLINLPAGGFTGRIPKWPLPENPRLAARIGLLTDEIEVLEEKDLDEGLSRTEKTKLSRTRERLAIAEAERTAIIENEKDLWRKLWRTPQAAQWARNKWDREVAQYVRHKAAAEIGSLEDSKEARMRADALGLTPKGMRTLLWVVPADEVTEKREQRGQAATGTDGKPAARRRLKAVDTSDD